MSKAFSTWSKFTNFTNFTKEGIQKTRCSDIHLFYQFNPWILTARQCKLFQTYLTLYQERSIYSSHTSWLLHVLLVCTRVKRHECTHVRYTCSNTCMINMQLLIRSTDNTEFLGLFAYFLWIFTKIFLIRQPETAIINVKIGVIVSSTTGDNSIYLLISRENLIRCVAGQGLKERIRVKKRKRKEGVL